jgi:hypothetical protein
VAPTCTNCGANDFLWANELKTGMTGGGSLSLRSRGEVPLGARICRQCGHAELFLRDLTILHHPHTWRPGEFIPIPSRPASAASAQHARASSNPPAPVPTPTPVAVAAAPAVAPASAPPPSPPPVPAVPDPPPPARVADEMAPPKPVEATPAPTAAPLPNEASTSSAETAPPIVEPKAKATHRRRAARSKS